MFFKKKTQTKSQSNVNPRSPMKEKLRLSNEDFLDNRLYEFRKKVRKLSQDEASAILLARHLSRLVRANMF